MIIFAFLLSLVINYVEKQITPIDNPFAKRTEKQDTEPVNKPEQV